MSPHPPTFMEVVGIPKRSWGGKPYCEKLAWCMEETVIRKVLSSRLSMLVYLTVNGESWDVLEQEEGWE